MAQLIDEIGELWEISLDLLAFYHECCYNCQPREDGEYVWLTEQYRLGDVLENIVRDVCRINNHSLIISLSDKNFNEALSSSPFSCPNCGTEHYEVGSEIGGEWLVEKGEDTNKATYLLTKTYWQYLSHYTKPSMANSGLDNLLKIVKEDKILPTNKFIYGSKSVTCFTECSPLEISVMLETMDLKKDELPFNAEIQKWERSKHAICINREALIEAGALPVLHGDSTLEQLLPDLIKWRYVPFRREKGFSDWVFEREFRIPNGVVLSKLNYNNVFLLVADKKEQFEVLARRDIPIYAVVPFNYIFPKDSPYPEITQRQIKMRLQLKKGDSSDSNLSGI